MDVVCVYWAVLVARMYCIYVYTTESLMSPAKVAIKVGRSFFQQILSLVR